MGSPRDNNFQAFRFIFAGLVILGHAPELIDGDRQRELLFRLTGTTSFGELAVGGFFLISGYLITQSWNKSPKLHLFMQKRVIRIFPAYLIAFVLSITVCGVLASENPAVYFSKIFTPYGGLLNLTQALTLSFPLTPSVFSGGHYPVVNGAMWTLRYELAAIY